MRQKPITKAIAARLPKLYAQETVADPIVHLKFFNPCGAQTWYILEGERDEDEDGDFRMFGYVTGMGADELGYVSLNELMDARLPYGLYIERDIHFTPCPLSTFRKVA